MYIKHSVKVVFFVDLCINLHHVSVQRIIIFRTIIMLVQVLAVHFISYTLFYANYQTLMM